LIGGGAKAPFLLAQELQKLGLEVTVFTASLLFGDSPVPSGIDIKTPGFNRGWRFKFPLYLLARRARKAILEKKPSLVVVCGVTTLAQFLLKSDCADKLLIWEFSNASPGNPLVNWKAAGLLGRARAVLSPSSSIDHQIRVNYQYDGNLLRLPFWVEQAGGCANEGRTAFQWDFIYLGRRDPEKGLFELITACAFVARKRAQLRVLIAGPGDETAYKERATDLGVAQNIQFTFFATEEETMTALSNSRYLVLPSYHEGYPLVLLEAAKFGKPFVATRVGSVPEMLGASEAGMLVPPKNPEALFLAMMKALEESDDAYRQRCVAARQLFANLSGTASVQKNLIRFVNANGG
jgi:glycosyltransferase involved in cell wall biosynthesis